MKKILEALLGPVYYPTTDLENGNRATDLALPHDIRLEVLFPRDLLGLTAHGRRLWLAGLVASPPRVSTLVHSYDFEEGAEGENVALAQRLDDRLLRRALASLSVGANVPA